MHTTSLFLHPCACGVREVCTHPGACEVARSCAAAGTQRLHVKPARNYMTRVWGTCACVGRVRVHGARQVSARPRACVAVRWRASAFAGVPGSALVCEARARLHDRR